MPVGEVVGEGMRRHNPRPQGNEGAEEFFRPAYAGEGDHVLPAQAQRLVSRLQPRP